MAMAGGIFLWQPAESTASVGAVIDPVVWKPKQRGYVDLFVNVAVMAGVAATMVVRPPVYVTRPFKTWTQVEHAPNLAALKPAQIRNAPEPTAYKRVAQQLDIAPNLAVGATPIAQVVQNQVEPIAYKRAAQQLDVAPNLAASTGTVTIRIAPWIDAVSYPRKAPQIELPANVALSAQQPGLQNSSSDAPKYPRAAPQLEVLPNLAFIVEIPPVTRAPFYMQYQTRYTKPPDNFPNLAVGTVTVQSAIAPWIDPITYPRKAQAIDVFPNIALSAQQPGARNSSDAPRYPRAAPQLDFSVNIAVNGTSSLSFIVSSDDALPARRGTQPDLFPNLAAQLTTPQPRLLIQADPAFYKRVAQQPDVLPNVAVGAQQLSILGTPEPTLFKRLSAQMDVLPNLSIFATETFIVPPAPIEPTKRIVPAPQIDVLPNIAVAFDNPIIVVPPTPGSAIGGSGGGGGRHRNYAEERRKDKEFEDDIRRMYRKLVRGEADIAERAEAVTAPVTADVKVVRGKYETEEQRAERAAFTKSARLTADKISADMEIAMRLLEEELDQRAENMRRIQLILQLI